MGNASMLIDFYHKECGHVTQGENIKDNIIGEGIVRNTSTIIIYGVLLVKWLIHNLLSTSQLCDKGYSNIFNTLDWLIEHTTNKELVFNVSRVDNICTLDLEDVSKKGTKCLATQSENSWLWHICLSHDNFDLINRIT